jgi:hypothetical protein
VEKIRVDTASATNLGGVLKEMNDRMRDRIVAPTQKGFTQGLRHRTGTDKHGTRGILGNSLHVWVVGLSRGGHLQSELQKKTDCFYRVLTIIPVCTTKNVHTASAYPKNVHTASAYPKNVHTEGGRSVCTLGEVHTGRESVYTLSEATIKERQAKKTKHTT